MLALLAALPQEIAGLRRNLLIEHDMAIDGWRLTQARHGGRQIMLVQSGVGKERAECAARAVLRLYPVSALVSFGFAGALSEDLAIGDIILCANLQAPQQPKVYRCDAALLDRATLACNGYRVRRGNNITVPAPVRHPQRKRSLAAGFAADTVDMESYWLARAAAEAAVPFLALRAVVDGASDRLPDLQSLLDGEGHWPIALHLLSHPWQLPAMATLARNSRAAATRMTGLLCRLVEQLS